MLKISVVLVLGFAHLSNCDLSLEEKECLAKETIRDEKSGKCYAFLTQGPCKKGERFVLDRPTGLNPDVRGVCKKELCDGGKIYWTETKECINEKTDKVRLCGNSKNSELSTNVFGEAECICNKSPPHARVDDNSKSECYLLYGREPCQKGQIFAYKNESSDFPECIGDPCDKETKRRKINGTLAKGKYLVQWSDGICYELDTQGPCPTDGKLKIDDDNKPNCVKFINAIFSLEKDCHEDESGQCQQLVFVKKRNADDYLKNLYYLINKRNKQGRQKFNGIIFPGKK